MNDASVKGIDPTDLQRPRLVPGSRPTQSSRDSDALDSCRPPDRARLGWIIAFKAFKAITLTALGIVLITTRHSDPLDLFVRLALAVHLPVSSRVLERLLAFISGLTITRPTALAMTAFSYAALMGSEGIALYLRKSWALWFTIIATTSLVPIEVYEIVRKPDVSRALVLLINVAIVVYLWRRRDFLEED